MAIDTSSIGPNAGQTANYVYDEAAEKWVPQPVGGGAGPAGDVYVKNAEIPVRIVNPPEQNNKVEVTNFPPQAPVDFPDEMRVVGEVRVTNFRLPEIPPMPTEMKVNGAVEVTNFPAAPELQRVEVTNFPEIPAPVVNVPPAPEMKFPTDMKVSGVVSIDNLPEPADHVDVRMHEQDENGDWVPVRRVAPTSEPTPEPAAAVQHVIVDSAAPLQVVGRFWQTTQDVRDAEVVDLLTEMRALMTEMRDLIKAQSNG